MGFLDLTDEFKATVDAWDGTIGAPSARNRKTNRVPVYKNWIMENVLATTHPFLPFVWFGGFILYGAYQAVFGWQGAIAGVALYLIGVLSFTLIEYLLHRYPFHLDAQKHPRLKTFIFMMHGYHHEFPNDKWRLVAPPLMSWPLALVVGALWYWIAGPELWLIGFGGTTAGYVFYDWVHYYTHHFRSPRTQVGKVLRRSHMVHHFKLFDLNMGISTPLWDLVFISLAWTEATIKEAMAEAVAVEAQSGDAPHQPIQPGSTTP